MRAISGILIGYALAIVAVGILSFSDSSLSKSRLIEIVAKASQDGSLNWTSYHGQDFFTECSLITMEMLRPESALKNAVDTYFANDFRYHPCDNLKYKVLGGGPSKLEMEITSYQSYPFGSRHLAGFLFNFLNFDHLRQLYMVLSYLSVIALGAAALIRQPRKPAIVTAIISVSLLLGSSLQSHGYNIGHAPSYIVGFFALALFIWLPQIFQQATYRWAFFAGLGIALAYFDMFCGATPIILAFTIVFDRLFYSPDKPFFSALGHAIGITATLAAAYAILTGGRLAILYFVYGMDGSPTFAGMMIRASNLAGSHVITYREIFLEIWDKRHMLAPGFTPTGLFFASVAAWIAAIAWSRRRTDLAIFGIAALGCLSWIVLFPNHAYVHPWMDVRLFAVPIALGFGALTNQMVHAAGLENQNGHPLKRVFCPPGNTGRD